MKIRIGTAGIPWSSPQHDLLSGIRQVKKLQLQALEVEFVRGVNLSIEKAQEVGKLAQELGIKLSVHAPYFINLASKETKKIKASQQRILQSVERAQHLKANIVVIHPGYYNDTKEKTFQMMEESLQELAEKITKSSWPVKIGLETTGKLAQFGTLDEILALCREIPTCVPVIDFAHLYAYHQGKINWSALLKKITFPLHCHFSGIEFSPRGEKRHLPISSENPPFRPLAQELLKIKNLDITIICESPLQEDDALLMKKTLKNLGYEFK